MSGIDLTSHVWEVGVAALALLARTATQKTADVGSSDLSQPRKATSACCTDDVIMYAVSSRMDFTNTSTVMGLCGSRLKQRFQRIRKFPWVVSGITDATACSSSIVL